MAQVLIFLHYVLLLSLFAIFGSVNSQTTTNAPVSTPTPIQPGQVGNCIGWRYVQASDTCDNIVTRYQAAPISLTRANLLRWNPALGSDCAGLTPKYYVCVRIDPTITTTTTTSSTTTAGPVATPSPVQAGQVGNCVGWRYIQSSDTCANLVTRFSSIGLTLARLVQWNPALGTTSNCTPTPKFFVCVQVGAGTTTTTTTTTSRTTTPSFTTSTTSRTTTSSTTSTTSRTTTTTSRTTTTTSRTTTTTSRTTTTSATPTNTYTPVVGAGTCTHRLKIEDLQANQPDVFNLFILALREIQNAASNNDLSWYQLSGIHGAPFIPWQQPENGQYDRSVGYCTHHSVIFGTWHRPYLVLLEQTLARTGLSIAQTFTGEARTRYVAAAAQLRLPYWDWADPGTQSHLPTVCMTPTIQVRAPNPAGSPVATTINNPLFSYSFKGTETNTFAGQFRTWGKTTRQPDSSGNSRDSVADTSMQSGFSTRQRSTFNSFTRTTFNAFSNAIENVHDDVHGRVGGGGHMSYVPYSSFDPIFWLHHVNIDRLMAMYQAANPGVTLTAGNAVGTFARPAPPATQDNINTPLYPFRRTDMSWWTSVQASSASTIWENGYGYAEVPCSYQGQSASALDSFTTTQINRLYSGSSSGSRKSKRDDTTPYIEWDAKVVVDQSELPGVFMVYIYLGKPEADYNLWPLSGREIGSLSSLGFPGRRKKSMIRSAVIPISPVLEERGINLDTDKMVDYLKQELTWVILNNGLPVNVSTVKSLKVAITATEYKPSDSPDELPKLGKPKFHLNITKGKHGGANSTTDVEAPTLLDGQKGLPATGLQS